MRILIPGLGVRAARRAGIAAAFLALAALWSAPPAAEAVIATRVIEGNPAAEGTTFTLETRVASNDTGSTPVAIAFRLSYPTAALEFVTARAADLGPVRWNQRPFVTGPGGSVTETTIVTLSNFLHGKAAPVAFSAVFRVKPGAPRPYGIKVMDETRPGTVPVVSTQLKDIPHRFDNSAIETLAPAAEAPAPKP